MKLHPWQTNLLDTLGGVKHGEMFVISAGRQTGKSVFNQYLMKYAFANEPKFRVMTSAPVDGELWYTIRCTDEVAKWVRTQNKDLWYSHIDSQWYVYNNMFDMSEKLYTLLNIRWGDQ